MLDFLPYGELKEGSLQVRSYLSQAFDDHEKAAFDMRRACKGDLRNFDTMVGTGLSGSLFIPPLAQILEKKYAIVRKSTENSHSGLPIEGDLGRKWIFVDDFTSSGATRSRVMAAIKRVCADTGWLSEYVGEYLYTYSIERRWRPVSRTGW